MGRQVENLDKTWPHGVIGPLLAERIESINGHSQQQPPWVHPPIVGTEIIVKLKVIEVRPNTLGGLLPLCRLVKCAEPGKLWPLEGHL